nr:TonB-dependent receptor [Xanthomonadaceae bacterium]
TSDYRSRVRWTTSWQRDDWDATVLMNRVGSFPIWNPNNTRFVNGQIDSRVGPHIVWNLSVGKEIIDDKLSMRVNVNNVFDRIAPRDNSFNSYPYFWQGNNPVGREIGLQLDYKFN